MKSFLGRKSQRREGFVEKVSFKPEVIHWGSSRCWEWHVAIVTRAAAAVAGLHVDRAARASRSSYSQSTFYNRVKYVLHNCRLMFKRLDLFFVCIMFLNFVHRGP